MELWDVLKQFNWVDILVIILLFRIGYIALKSGFSRELFKLLGTLLAIYLALHYYTGIVDFISARIATKKIPLDFLGFVIFTLLAAIGYLVFFGLRCIFYHFIKMEAIPLLNKWGGLVLGIGRGILLVGLVIYILVISSFDYAKKSVENSPLGRSWLKVAPATYSIIWHKLTSKFMIKEKFNESVLEVKIHPNS